MLVVQKRRLAAAANLIDPVEVSLSPGASLLAGACRLVAASQLVAVVASRTAEVVPEGLEPATELVEVAALEPAIGSVPDRPDMSWELETAEFQI